MPLGHLGGAHKPTQEFGGHFFLAPLPPLVAALAPPWPPGPLASLPHWFALAPSSWPDLAPPPDPPALAVAPGYLATWSPGPLEPWQPGPLGPLAPGRAGTAAPSTRRFAPPPAWPAPLLLLGLTPGPPCLLGSCPCLFFLEAGRMQRSGQRWELRAPALNPKR